MPNRDLVVDANILVRAVLGKRLREVIEAYAEDVSFFVPEAAYCEAENTCRRSSSSTAVTPRRRSHSCAACEV